VRFGRTQDSFHHARGVSFELLAPAYRYGDATLTLRPVPNGNHKPSAATAREFD
jgi:hypothetical protein